MEEVKPSVLEKTESEFRDISSISIFAFLDYQDLDAMNKVHDLPIK